MAGRPVPVRESPKRRFFDKMEYMNLQKHLQQLKKISSKDDKTKGYGGNPQKFIDPFLPWFKVIFYRKGPYLVIDRYTGDEQYGGQTVTYFKKKPVSLLNYYGLILNKKFKTDIVNEIIKAALRAGVGKSLYRGLNNYRNNGFVYKNTYTEKRGLIEGEEKIYYQGKLIYLMVYRGGTIQDNRSYKRWSKNLLPSKKLKEIKFK